MTEECQWEKSGTCKRELVTEEWQWHISNSHRKVAVAVAEKWLWKIINRSDIGVEKCFSHLLNGFSSASEGVGLDFCLIPRIFYPKYCP